MEIFKLLGTIAIKGVDQAKTDLKETSEEAVETADGIGKTIDKVAKLGVKVAAVTSAAVTAIGGLAMSSSNGMEEAMDDFTSSTNISTESLSEYEDVLKSIYKNNYGESFEDIAHAMAIIKQQAGDISSEELEKMTTDALVLKDTFEFEVNESMRAAKMLMNQFAISGTEAFNLIAQATQNGLDKNGDLLDSINEYSVHYKQLGFTAEDFFNSLQNGTKAGTFSVDKLGDAMKEFGIRVKDGSDTSTQAFETLGYNADEMFQIFNEGGETAATATQELINKIASMPNGVEKTTAGVALFGTMWEDLGETGIKALSDLDGSISVTNDALQSINDNKYDNLNSRLSGLKRKLETSLITPLGKKLQPLGEKMIKMVEKKMPSLQKLFDKLGNKIVDIFDDCEPAFEWLIEDALPTLIDILGFVIGNFDKLAVTIGLTVAAFKTMQIISVVSTAIQGASGAMEIFNAVMAANPIGLVATAIGGLVIAIGGLCASMDEEEEQLAETKQKIEEETLAREERRQAIEDERAAIDKKAESELAEVARTEDLWKELQLLVDENGNVTEANKTRADFILNELNEALGTEYTMTGNQIQNYKDLTIAVNEAIQSKKAEILLAAQEEKYKSAIQNIDEAQNRLTEADIALSKEKNKYEKMELLYLEDKEAYENRIKDLTNEMVEAESTGNSIRMEQLRNERTELYNNMEASKLNWELAKATLQNQQQEYAAAKSEFEMYCSDMAAYENAQTELLKGNTEKAIEYLDNLGSAYQTAEDLAEEGTERRKAMLKKQYEDAEANVSLLKELMKTVPEEEKNIYNQRLKEAEEYVADCKEQYLNAGGKIVKSLAEGAENNSLVLKNAMGNVTFNAISGCTEKKLDFENIGKDMVLGIVAGIENEEPTSLKTMDSLVNSMINRTKLAADINSPSKRFEDEIGVYIPSGVGKGVKKNMKNATEPVEDMIDSMVVSGKSGVSSERIVTSVDNTSTLSILNKLDQLINVMTQQKIYLNNDVLVGELAPAMDSSLGNIYSMKGRGQ